MQVHRDIDHLPLFKNAAVTIGTFDGVHTGHLQIIRQLKEEAKKINGESVIITFDPHPRMVLQDRGEIRLLNTLEEKIQLMELQSIDHLVVVPFTKEFSEQSAEVYIRNFLVEKFHPHTIIIGYDHHFGRNRQGNYKLLELYADELNYQVKEIPEHVLNQVTISSTKIREAIAGCDIETADKYLGYDYFFEGEVVKGDGIGRTLGFPTANLLLNNKNKLVPANGIYAVRVVIDNGQLATCNEKSGSNESSSIVPRTSDIKLLKGMMSIGFRPTIKNSKHVIEVNIFDFSENIYGLNLKVFVKKYLRPEKKFNSLEELKYQIADDKLKISEILKG